MLNYGASYTNNYNIVHHIQTTNKNIFINSRNFIFQDKTYYE